MTARAAGPAAKRPLPGAAAAAHIQRLLQQARWDEAERACRELLQGRPDDPVALNGLGLALKSLGRLPEAVEALRRAATVAPEDGSVRNNLGSALHALGQPEAALASYRDALARDPRHVEAQYNIGVVLETLGRNEAAMQAYRAAVALHPQHRRALVRIAALLHEQRRYTEALGAAEQVLALDPQSFEARYYRGVALSALGRHDESLADLERAVSQRPDRYEAAYAHALALRDAGRHDEALAALESVTSRWPQQAAAHVELNRLAWARGKRAVFLRSFTAARARVIHPDLLVAEATFRLRLNQFPDAERLLREAALIAPKRADAAALLGRALAGQRRFVESVEAFARAIELEPQAAAHRHELGLTLLQLGRPERAAESLENALQLDPHDQLALAGLTLAWRELGQTRYVELADPRRDIRVYDLFDGEPEARRRAFHAELAEELRRLHDAEVEPIDQTLHNGTQTTCLVFEQPLPAIQELRRRVERAVGDFIGAMPKAPGHPFLGRRTDYYGFSGSWSCRLRSGGFHGNHVHPAGWISSAYYVAVPESVARDSAGHSGWLALGQSNLALGAKDRPERLVQPGVGHLVLFPSYCWHGTVPFSDTAERLTVAFDVVPVTRPRGRTS